MKSIRPNWRLGRADATFTRGWLILLALLYPLAVLVPKVVRWIGGGALEWTTATSTAGPGAGPWLASLIPSVITWALLVIGYGVFVPASRMFADLGVLWNVDQTASLALVVDVAAIAVPLVIGALMLVVAESFAIGRRLAEDVEGLI